ncbi:MAG: hypothetical protein WCZ29_27030, partial [Mycolicibacterium vanbaalenii]|uniref:hypothetical protein n=1 Tax=Mycolicibacterium vanbaalenii TaxID=110539 RepID=UPI003566D54B
GRPTADDQNVHASHRAFSPTRSSDGGQPSDDSTLGRSVAAVESLHVTPEGLLAAVTAEPTG